MKKRIYTGKFYNDFSNFEISNTGKSVKCVESGAPIARRFKIHDAGTPYAYFDAPVFGGVVRYNLADFVKGAKK